MKDSLSHFERILCAEVMPDGVEALLESIHVGIYCLDPDGRFTHVSRMLATMLETTVEILVGTPFAEIFAPRDREESQRLIDLEPGTIKSISVELMSAQGQHIAVRIAHRASSPAVKGTAMGIVIITPSVGHDGASDMIRKLSIAVEQSPASVVITDTQGTIEYVNPKFTTLTGYSYAEAIGQNPRILKSGDQPSEFYRGMWETILAGREWRGEFHNVKKNGESYWESASISPMRNSAGAVTHFVAVKENITERKMIEEALRQRNAIMEKELSYAQTIVDRLLPREVPIHDTVAIAFRYIPLDAIGGDFFSFFQGQNGDLGIFVGDVVGHGVPAALYLAMVKSVTDRLYRHHGDDPVGLLTSLNRELTTSMSSYFLTALYGHIRQEAGELSFRFAKGGHPEPLYIERATATARFLPCRGRAIGIVEAPVFELESLTLRPGDRLYLYSDGVSETVNRVRHMITPEELASMALATLDKPLRVSVDGIIDALGAFRDGGPVEDDIVLVGIEVKG